jgi:uncharacterized membrane protein YqhA
MGLFLKVYLLSVVISVLGIKFHKWEKLKITKLDENEWMICFIPGLNAMVTFYLTGFSLLDDIFK